MAAKSNSFPEKLRVAVFKLPKPAAAEKPPVDPQFVCDLIRRGEAVKSEPGRELPPGATHEFVVEHGKARVVRRRFSAA